MTKCKTVFFLPVISHLFVPYVHHFIFFLSVSFNSKNQCEMKQIIAIGQFRLRRWRKRRRRNSRVRFIAFIFHLISSSKWELILNTIVVSWLNQMERKNDDDDGTRRCQFFFRTLTRFCFSGSFSSSDSVDFLHLHFFLKWILKMF